MSFITIADTRDWSFSLRLRSLIGADRTGRLGAGHPLGSGFRALQRLMRGRDLSDVESDAFARLQMNAELIWSLEESWRPYESQFVKGLVSTDACVALLLELDVIRRALRPTCGEVTWTRYQAGMPDIKTVGPEMWVECKLLRESAKVESVFNALHRAQSQHEDLNLPYVIAVGFSREVPSEEVVALPGLLRERQEWFKAHPHLSGVVILTPAADREYPLPNGDSISAYESGVVTQCLNSACLNPLPQDFTFNPGIRRPQLSSSTGRPWVWRPRPNVIAP